MRKSSNREKMRKTDWKADQELRELELALEPVLGEFDVEYPSEAELMKTVDAIRPHVPRKQSKPGLFQESLISILKQSVYEMFYFSPLFWVANCLFLLAGLAAMFMTRHNPYFTVMLLAPLPTLIGFTELLKSKYAGMAELEMSLKYSFQEIVLAKMTVIGGFNLLVNVAYTFCVYVLDRDLLLWKFILFWAAPFTMITFLSLVVVTKFRHQYGATMIGLALWAALGSFASMMNGKEAIESMVVPVFLVITVAASIGTIVHTTRMYKRGAHFEFNDR